MTRTLVVGDVHGCADELQELVQRVAPDDVVLVGDLFTKGPDPAGVQRLVNSHMWRFVLGNHDDRLLKIHRGQRTGDRKGRRCIAALASEDSDWAAGLAARPLFIDIGPWTVVHAGLAPQGVGDTTREMALVMRRWPFRDVEAPFWYEVYCGDRRVVFGHDAARGHVRRERDGVPWLIGLDTGCVYGGALSGYVLETDELFQVPARRAYRSF
jgi:hypothetical protein